MMHKTAEFEHLVRRMMDEWRVPGLSIAIIQGEEIYSKSYGYADIPGKECTNEALFDLASVAKMTTAAAVASLVDDENYPEVQWTTPVSTLLSDDFVLADPEYTKNVTIEDILSHRSGIPSHDYSYLGIRAQTPDNARSITRNLRNLPLNKPIRSTYQYCNIMYTAAAHLVETVSRENYIDFLRARLWEPLGMANTYHDLPDIEARSTREKVATGYRWDKEKNVYIPISSYQQPEGQGAGCIYSTATSYAKFIRALIHRAPPLSPAVHEALVTPRTIMPVGPDEQIPFSSTPLYAFGLVVETYRGHKVVGHNGSVPGFQALVRYLPEFEWGVVILVNGEDGFHAEEVLSCILVDDMLGVPGAERVDWAAFWREWAERDEKMTEEENNSDEFQVPAHAEVLGVEIRDLAGKYRNIGYHELELEMREGELVAGCRDRCFGFDLTFAHLTGSKFVVEATDVLVNIKTKMKGEFRISADGKVEALGVDFEPDMKGPLIWFDRL